MREMRSSYIRMVVVLLMALLCLSCSPQLCLQKRTNRLSSPEIVHSWGANPNNYETRKK